MQMQTRLPMKNCRIFISKIFKMPKSDMLASIPSRLPQMSNLQTLWSKWTISSIQMWIRFQSATSLRVSTSCLGSMIHCSQHLSMLVMSSKSPNRMHKWQWSRKHSPQVCCVNPTSNSNKSSSTQIQQAWQGTFTCKLRATKGKWDSHHPCNSLQVESRTCAHRARTLKDSSSSNMTLNRDHPN